MQNNISQNNTVEELMWIDGEQTFSPLWGGPLLLGEIPQTTMLALDGKIVFLEEHFFRLHKAFHYFDPQGNWQILEKQIVLGLRSRLPNKGRHRVRVVVFRDAKLGWHYGMDMIEVQESNAALRVCWAKGLRGVPIIPSELKLGAYCEADAEKRDAFLKGFDDVVFLNHRHQVLEGTRSNVFFRFGDRLVTPLKQNGMLAGITRQKVIHILRAENIPLEERFIEAKEANMADEVWLTASVSGIRQVSKFNDRVLSDQNTGNNTWKEVVTIYKKLCQQKAQTP